MWSSSSKRPRAAGAASNRTVNIRRYLGRGSQHEYSPRSFESVISDRSDGRGENSSMDSIDENSVVAAQHHHQQVASSSSTAAAPLQFNFESDWMEYEGNSSYQEEDSFRSQEEQNIQVEVDYTPEEGENLDIEHYMLSVFDKGDDSSTIYTGGTASTSFSSMSSNTVSTRTRHRGAYQRRKRFGNNNQSSSTTARVAAQPRTTTWMESMENISFQHSSLRHDVEWTPKNGWVSKTPREAQKGTWDASPTTDWYVPNPIFDTIAKERIEI